MGDFGGLGGPGDPGDNGTAREHTGPEGSSTSLPAGDKAEGVTSLSADPALAFYDQPVAAQDLIANPPEDQVKAAKKTSREELVPLAIETYRDILSDPDPTYTSQRLSAARDVLSDTGPFAAGSPPYGQGVQGAPGSEGQPGAAFSNLISAFAEFQNGTVVAVKDMRHVERTKE